MIMRSGALCRWLWRCHSFGPVQKQSRSQLIVKRQASGAIKLAQEALQKHEVCDDVASVAMLLQEKEFEKKLALKDLENDLALKDLEKDLALKDMELQKELEIKEMKIKIRFSSIEIPCMLGIGKGSKYRNNTVTTKKMMTMISILTMRKMMVITNRRISGEALTDTASAKASNSSKEKVAEIKRERLNFNQWNFEDRIKNSEQTD